MLIELLPYLWHNNIAEAGLTGGKAIMQTVKYVYWQEEGMWLGYLEEFPDYWTQGETREELEENLRDLYHDLMSGEIPSVRRVAEMELAQG